MSGAWTFSPIQYVKRANPDGTQSPGYIFGITAVPVPLEMIVKEATTEHVVARLKEGEFVPYIAEGYTQLLKAHARHFTKSYTPAQCMRLTSHTIQMSPPDDSTVDEYACTLIPKSIILFGGRFTLQWAATFEPFGIELALEEDEVTAPATVPPQNSPAVAGTDGQIIEVDDIESIDDAESGPSFRSGPAIPSDRQTRDRRRVEEFRLRATLAAVRAERALERYIEKYGDYDIESSDSDATSAYTTDADASD